ncbi:MAG: amidohydrolase family protein [Firmicutes bacterium]|nr:amidohydrolase family protein [Bacillota bacterium]
MIRIGNVKIIDFHVHFYAVPEGPWPPQPPHPDLAEYSRRRDRRMAQEWDHGTPEPPARTLAEEDALADRWVAEMERYDLERIVFVTGSSNANMARQLRRHPGRFEALCFLRDPAAPGALDELKRCIEEWGFKGLKLLGPRVDTDWDDPRLTPMWEYLAERRLPVLIHFGPLGKGGGVVWHKHISPLSIYPVARRYPEIPFVIPHFGCGYIQDLLWLMWSLPNIYVDTSGSNQWMQWMVFPMNLEIAFRKFYETVGPERIIFGTDSSWFPRGFAYRYLQDQVRTCRQLNFREEDLELIFRHNAARLLRLG